MTRATPGTGPDPSGPGPLRPEDLRRLESTAGEAQAFASMHRGDPVAPAGELIVGFEITDLRRFITQLDEARACDDAHAEDVARALIAGYIRAALQAYDREGRAG